MTEREKRVAALMACFDAETAADVDFTILHRHADRMLDGHARVHELREAGLTSQADDLLRRLNDYSREVAGLPGPSQSRPNSQQPHAPLSEAPRPNVPAVNGVINGNSTNPLSSQPRRGRPPKNPNNAGTQS